MSTDILIYFRNFCCRPETSLNLSRKAGDITMIKNTLYNSGGYKKKDFLYCFVASFYIHLLIPNIKKVTRRHVFGKKNTSASMLRVYWNNPTGTAFKSNHLNSNATQNIPLHSIKLYTQYRV